MGSPLTQAGLLLVNAIGSIVLLIVMMRFLLQLVRADFYNPISQMIVKFTNPMLIPLRRVIPGFGGLDVASLVLAVGVQYLILALILMLATGGANLPFIEMVGWAFVGILKLLFSIYFWGMLIVVIASWVAPGSYNPALILINQLLEPLIRPIRKILPDMGGLDLSPLVVMLGIQLAEVLVLYPLKQVLGIPSGLIMGL
ncbi:MAG: YggT family protein [Thalassolituus sp.]|jgi:YggT family protein|nr:YggT family protein [Pseudomonadota bacterium]MEC8102113.1 YggT family protein [Pseudomonadota bacterium]MEE2748544.1 YggT family protein [Pseudomonadota bacterium]TNC86909.1 MAG: YggT family protein [Thalassolituus sp.]|tara:strand:+ start:2945 stop:3541 length:597 start_codon:yes stop_codon:yes gene_type:complete